MISVVLSRLVVLIAGMLYPAYKSYKAVRTKDAKEYVKWMMYWIVFAIFCVFETFADIFVSFWLPFYYELKIAFVLWLLSPWTKGASILYRKWVHPTLSRHEEDIDSMLEQAKSESYNQVLRLGSRGLLCAREIITTAALRGQAQLVQQLQRSYSTSDIPKLVSLFKTLVFYFSLFFQVNKTDSCETDADEVRHSKSKKTRNVNVSSDLMYNTLPRRTRHYK
uniref:Receptor expression-enhancing protein n=1 Tax=Syphacia muris TaxID=451379 RepID=A0A0N5A8Z9_9BILA